MSVRFIIIYALTFCLATQPAFVEAQTVVPLSESPQPIAEVGNRRAENLADVRGFFSGDRARAALEWAKFDYTRIDKAVATLSPEDLARVAAHTRQIQKDSVVSPVELRAAIAASATTRAKNLEDVRTFFSSDRVRSALKSARVDYQRIDKAVATLSPDDLARVAARTRHMQEDFAAGEWNGADYYLLIAGIALIVIVLVIVYCVGKDENGRQRCAT